MRTRTRLTAFLFAAAAAFTARADQHPNLERGFAADKMYQFGDVDHVNLFNGNLSVTMPIGKPLVVSEHLSVGLTLIYNTKLWDPETKSLLAETGIDAVALRKFPNRHSNAGFGWLLSLGRMIEPNEIEVNPQNYDWHYEGPDGSDHIFYGTLHNTNPVEPSAEGISYTRDGTYLRLHMPSSLDLGHIVVDFPDGTVQEFASYYATHPDGTVARHWRIVKIGDAFGNHVDVVYGTLGYSIVDQYGRSIVVHLQDMGAGDAQIVQWNYLTAVSSVDVPASNGRTATYTLSYGPSNNWVYRGFCGEEVGYSHDSYAVKVPVLRQVTLTDGSAYDFTYPASVDQNTPPSTNQCGGGQLASLTLPTKGVISWTYQDYLLPARGCDLGAENVSSGVATRTFHDPYNTVTPDPQWTYAQHLSEEASGSWVCGPNQVAYGSPPSEELQITVHAPSGDDTVHYFSIWPQNQPAPDPGVTRAEYGLPLSRKEGSNGKFISQKFCQGLCSPGTVLRREYVKYDHDPGDLSRQNLNRRVSATRSVHYDTNGNPDHTADVDYSDFDGVGHYRVATSTGTFPDRNNTRTVTTGYNRSEVGINVSVPGVIATGTYDPTLLSGGAFFAPPSTAPWIIGLYTSVTTTEGSESAVQHYCFAPATGFQRGVRVLKAASAGLNDVLTVFSSDSNSTGGAAGNATREQSFGADVQAVDTNELCTVVGNLESSGTPYYDIRHVYDHAVRKSTQYFFGATAFPLSLDLTVDANTGLPTSSRDSAGLQTDFIYDTSGRVLTATTQGMAAVSYTYVNAGASPATASVSQGASFTATGRVAFNVTFDFLGRISREQRLLSDQDPFGGDRYATRLTGYDRAGRKVQVSEWEESNSPSHFTVFSGFDPFGRATRITRPDGKFTDKSYVGVHAVTSTTKVQTDASEHDAVTTELYDRFGRLYRVTDANGTLTDYNYDIGGRLALVTMGVQSRTFTYDHLGFLRTEKHPELGTGSADGIAYGSYDPKGHAGSKITGPANGPFDLSYSYDRAERLIDVFDLDAATHVRRSVKHFDYAAENTTGANGLNYRKGKLETSVRHNYLPGVPGDLRVTEILHYENNQGTLSARDTQVDHVRVQGDTIPVQRFTQSFTYNNLGQTTGVKYPTCQAPFGCNGTLPIDVLDHQYFNGRLSQITGYATSISYHPNEMIRRFVHGVNNVVEVADVMDLDGSGMARPGTISFTGYDDCVPPNVIIQGVSAVCPSSSGNVASVDPVTGATYSWSITNGSITAGDGTTSITYLAAASGTLTLSVTVTKPGCGATTVTKPVTIRQAPTATITSGNATVPPATNISVALTGTAPWTLTWSDGHVDANIPASPFTRSVNPTTTTQYSITAVSDATCSGTINGGPVTISAGTAPPAPVIAGSTDDFNNRWGDLLWPQVSGAAQYRIERSASRLGPFSPVVTLDASQAPQQVFYSDHSLGTSIPLPVTYVYRVIAISSGGLESPPSNLAYATVCDLLFPDSPIQGGVTPIRGSHVAQLRRGIDAVRAAAALQAHWTSYAAPTGVVFASTFTDMRTALDEAVLAITGHTVHYNLSAPAQGGIIYGGQIDEIRTGVR